MESFEDALSPEFDRFYDMQARLEYGRCEQGYLVDAEGPQFETDGNTYWKHSQWSEWT